MTELLRDPAWQFVGAIVSVFAIVLSVGTVWWQGYRRLCYQIHATPLLAVDPTIQADLQITYNGRTVTDVHLVEAVLRNAGNVPIRADQFAKSLKFVLNREAQILSVAIAQKLPDNLDVKIDTTTDAESGDPSIIVEPLLLNAGEKFTIAALVTGWKNAKPVARIEGLSSLHEDKERIRRARFVPPLIFGTTALLCAWMLIRLNVVWAAVIGVVVAALALAYVWLKTWRKPLAIAALAIAMFFIAAQLRYANDQFALYRQQQRIDTAKKHFDAWSAPSMVLRRGAAVSQYPHGSPELLDVFNFFEHVAYQERTGAITARDVDYYFREPAILYWCAFEPWVQAIRKSQGEHPLTGATWEDYQRLAKKLREGSGFTCPDAAGLRQQLITVEVERAKAARTLRAGLAEAPAQ